MSLFDYEHSLRLASPDNSFYSLIMAAMRRADSLNWTKLEMAFPEVASELRARYDAPGGILEDEQ